MFNFGNTYRKIDSVVKLPSRLIAVNPHQPRKNFNWNDIAELSESISRNGLLQPITVRRLENDRFELICGERRLKACKMAGISAIPSIIINATDEASALLPLIENIKREEINYFEEAIAIERLIKGFGLSQEEIARKLGVSKQYLVKKLQILRLPDEIRTTVIDYGLTERQVVELLKLPSVFQMQQVIDMIVERGLNISATEDLISAILAKAQPEKHGKTVMIFKDVRIFINTLNHAVNTMRNSGINANATKNETDKYIEYTVRIEKSDAGESNINANRY